MSGIYGVFQKMSENNVEKIDIRKMYAWNKAYGREKEDLYQGSFVSLGCCYEGFSDETVCTDLVIKNEHCFAVMDTLLYNRTELVRQYDFDKNISDEELVFRVLERQGMHALANVNGDFSGAIYDEQQQTLTLFRDHMGIRPLYYYADDRLVAFSTDIRGILALDAVDASINEDWIYRTLGGFYLDGVTVTEYKHIFCVKPGSYITFSFQDGMKVQEKAYWKLGSKKIQLSSFDEYKAKLRELVTDSVKRRLDAVSGMVGAELSGGLDSGVIDILIHRLGRECVHYSWSVDPKEVPYAENDERLVIEDICRQEGITCNFSEMCSDYSMKSNIARNMMGLGFSLQEHEPPALRYALPPYINALTLCETAACMKKNNVKVVFTGHGGDEGISHRCHPYELFYHKEYYHFFKYIWGASKGKKNRMIAALKICRRILGSDRAKLTTAFHMPFGAPELLKPEFSEKFTEKDMPLLHFAYSPIEYIQEGGSRNRLDNVALLGAYNGVRYITPYLDYRVIDFAVSIPRHLYINGTKNRYLFREAFKDIMPDSLYKLKFKEDNSRKNYVENDDWFTEFAQRKIDVNEKLDRNFWKTYLNFDVIDAWMKKGKPADEERRHDSNILMCLFYCSMAQNLIEKARNV